jgi:hypothetical protein
MKRVCALNGHHFALAAVKGFPARARMIDGDAVQPSREIGITAKLAGCSKRRQEHFLGDFRRFLCIAKHPVDQIKNGFFMTANQSFEGVRFSALNPPDAFRVTDAVRHHFFSLIRPIHFRKVPRATKKVP